MPLTGYASKIKDVKPSFIDTTSETTIYEGYDYGPSLIICKIDLSTPVITRTYALGCWVNRETLIYS